MSFIVCIMYLFHPPCVLSLTDSWLAITSGIMHVWPACLTLLTPHISLIPIPRVPSSLKKKTGMSVISPLLMNFCVFD